MLAYSAVLHHRRPAGGEIAGGAIAHPAGAPDHIAVLRHAELAARAPHVVAIALGVGSVDLRIAQLPAVCAQPRQLGLLRMNREAQLETVRRTLGELDQA